MLIFAFYNRGMINVYANALRRLHSTRYKSTFLAQKTKHRSGMQGVPNSHSYWLVTNLCGFCEPARKRIKQIQLVNITV